MKSFRILNLTREREQIANDVGYYSDMMSHVATRRHTKVRGSSLLLIFEQAAGTPVKVCHPYDDIAQLVEQNAVNV